MSLYIIEDDDGNVLDRYGYFDNAMIHARLYDEPLEPERYVKEYGGHVVKLVDAPAKIVVSEAEAKILDGAKKDKHPCMYIAWKVQVDDEDRLMRAYVIGWEVEKPKRYFVRVPHANRHYYYQKCDSGEVIPVWDMETEPPTQFTVAEIEHYELTDCEKVECENYD